jgi:hypothetical protein
MWTKGIAETCEMKVPFISVPKLCPSGKPRENIRTIEHMIIRFYSLISWFVAIKISLAYFYSFLLLGRAWASPTVWWLIEVKRNALWCVRCTYVHGTFSTDYSDLNPVSIICRLQTADCRLQTADQVQNAEYRYKLQTEIADLV